jgi:hypothetical protein
MRGAPCGRIARRKLQRLSPAEDTLSKNEARRQVRLEGPRGRGSGETTQKNPH